MIRSLLSLFLIIGAATLLALLWPAAAPLYACTPPAPPPDGIYPTWTVADRVGGADVVLVGEVTAVEGEPMQVATVAVEQYLKGRGPAVVTVDYLGPGSLCLVTVEEGQRGVFYATVYGDGGLRAYYYMPPFRPQLSAVGAADAESIAGITAVAGQDPFVPDPAHAPPAQDTPAASPILSPGSNAGDTEPGLPGFDATLPLLAALIAVAGVLLWRRWRR